MQRISEYRQRTKRRDRSITLDRHPRDQVVRNVDRHVTAGFDDVTRSDDDVNSHGRTTSLSVTFYTHQLSSARTPCSEGIVSKCQFHT